MTSDMPSEKQNQVDDWTIKSLPSPKRGPVTEETVKTLKKRRAFRGVAVIARKQLDR